MEELIRRILLIEPLDEEMDAIRDILLGLARDGNCQQFEEALLSVTAFGTRSHWLPFTELWEYLNCI